VTEGQSSRVEEAEPEVQRKLAEAIQQAFPAELLRQKNHAWVEYGLTYELKDHGAQFRVFQTLKEDPKFAFNMLVNVSAVDWMDRREPRFEVFYHLLSLTHLHRLCIKINVPEEKPEVESLRPLWPAANFMERELWDMFGVVPRNHGDLRRILLYDEFVGHPLRKDYPIRGKQPRVQLRIPELRNSSADMWREPLVPLPTRRGRIADTNE
jgi:NADH-quinone oxidoreductase subunit C